MADSQNDVFVTQEEKQAVVSPYASGIHRNRSFTVDTDNPKPLHATLNRQGRMTSMTDVISRASLETRRLIECMSHWQIDSTSMETA